MDNYNKMYMLINQNNQSGKYIGIHTDRILKLFVLLYVTIVLIMKYIGYSIETHILITKYIIMLYTIIDLLLFISTLIIKIIMTNAIKLWEHVDLSTKSEVVKNGLKSNFLDIGSINISIKFEIILRVIIISLLQYPYNYTFGIITGMFCIYKYMIAKYVRMVAVVINVIPNKEYNEIYEYIKEHGQ